MSDATASYHSRGSLKHRYLTVATPKVGCTTVKRTLHALEGLPPAEPWWAVHDEGMHLRLEHYTAAERKQLLTSPDILRFAFVRNPYDRTLSAWKSKILRDDASYAELRASVRAAYGYPPQVVVPFGDFVRYVAAEGPPDAHWEQQVEVLAYDTIPYDVLGRFENFAADFDAILRKLGAPDDVLALATEVTNPTEDIAMAAAYDSDVAAIVYDYYRDDFEAFGYERDSWLRPR